MSPVQEINKEVKVSKFGEFFVVQLSMMFGLVVVFFFVKFLPEYTNWLNRPDIFIYSLIFMFFFQLLILMITEVFKKNTIWQYTVYVWILWHTFFVYQTGGIESSFLFTFLFIPVISLFQMDAKEIRNHGILAGLLLFSLIFTDQKYWTNPSYITRHLINIAGFAIIVFLIQRFVKYTLAQKINNEQLKRKLTELEELDYTKQVFLTAMSHQLRTPLSAAKWAVEAVLKDKNCPQPEILIEGRDRIDQAVETIGKILKTAELEIDKENISIKQENFDLKLIIDKIITEQNYLIKDKGIKLVYEKYESVMVKGDAKMLSMSLTNIIDNAVRYSPQGTVHINLFKTNKDIIFTVEDSGIGIEAKDLEFILNQKFYRGKNAMTIDPNQSGVGLYVTKKIIEIHGGKIAISSVLNNGTKVSVALPLVTSV